MRAWQIQSGVFNVIRNDTMNVAQPKMDNQGRTLINPTKEPTVISIRPTTTRRGPAGTGNSSSLFPSTIGLVPLNCTITLISSRTVTMRKKRRWRNPLVDSQKKFDDRFRFAAGINHKETLGGNTLAYQILLCSVSPLYPFFLVCSGGAVNNYETNIRRRSR